MAESPGDLYKETRKIVASRVSPPFGLGLVAAGIIVLVNNTFDPGRGKMFFTAGLLGVLGVLIYKFGGKFFGR